MPQMSPIYWTLMMITINFTMMLMMTKLLFSTNLNFKTQKKIK